MNAQPPSLVRVGIDTGGTFTDVVAYDTAGDRLLFLKVHSTPDDPGRALVQGVQEVSDRLECGVEAIDLLVHGTTVATNVVVQRAGARVALITTAGFRDLLHIQRQCRPRLYEMRTFRAAPLVPRALRFEVDERILYDGTVKTPLNHEQLDEIIEQLKAAKVDAVAVAFLHSYVNPEHELEVARILDERFTGQVPGTVSELTVCLSHGLVREHGEYERFSTCAMNAYVQPLMERYLGHLNEALRDKRIDAPLVVMKSNGGVMAADRVAHQCVQTILSGPAGGVVAGAAIAAHHSNDNLITADMGGTSFDVAVIEGGRFGYVREAEIDGLALQVPMLDLHTVGAGGGSVGWIDAGGGMRVGPRSAGARPGPACYGLGGTEPTVTDANLVLGRLAVQSKLAGGMKLDIEAARKAIFDRLAGPLGLTVERAAEGVVRVINTIMVGAIRRLTVERGHDPRIFTLCAFGGAGPLHGGELAAEMGIGEILIPLAPGVTSALGLLMSNLREDCVRTHIQLLDEIQTGQIESMFDDLQQQARRRLTLKSGTATLYTVTRRLGLRYHGQGYDLPVELVADRVDKQQITSTFHAVHEKLYGYCRRDEPVELVSVWVSVELDLNAVKLPEVRPASGRPMPAYFRKVIFDGRSCETAVYDRDSLGSGSELTGPAIVEQVDSTTVILPTQKASVDRFGQIVLVMGEAKSEG